MNNSGNNQHNSGGENGDKKLKGAIFDLDGTLLDSMFIWDTMGEDYLISLGIVPENGLNEKFKTMSVAAAVAYYQTQYGILGTAQEIMADVNRQVNKRYLEQVHLKPGVRQLLQRFKSEGVRMCVATATDTQVAQDTLAHNGILDYFCTVLSCTQVGFGKDSPEIFERALETLGTDKSNTLVFEDALHAVTTAKAAGFKVVGVFDASSQSDWEKIKALADYCVINL